ncbi:ferredoxin [Candidatus Peregrinibacteria bacterium]|nr:ferredoxin [Candidatus Peregrinibacteria bacterium]
MFPKVDKEKCIGCGNCELLCMAVFKLNEDGKAEVLSDADFEKNKRCIQESIEMCPTKAISWKRP